MDLQWKLEVHTKKCECNGCIDKERTKPKIQEYNMLVADWQTGLV